MGRRCPLHAPPEGPHHGPMNDIERIGREVYRKAARSPWEPPELGMVEIAALLYHGDVIRESAQAQVEATTAWVNGVTHIVVRKGLSATRANFAIGRMIARLELKQLGAWSEDSERDLAAYIVAPREGFRARLYQVGIDLKRLAQPFAITETCAALRVVECTETEGLVVTPDRVYHPRGSLQWVRDPEARALAKGSPMRLRKVPIVDEPGRVALYRRAG